MESETGAIALLVSAVVIGVTHTLLGPDHYLPFVALGKARKWSQRRTMAVTAFCGFGHVSGSILIGALGVLAGWSLSSLEAFESARGELAAWLLIVLGLLYLVWAIRRMARSQTHTHVHVHANGTAHNHEHDHRDAHTHVHTANTNRKSTTFWSLFVIFVFGPCEALIPLLMFPAFGHNAGLAIAVVAVFTLSTILTMLLAVWAFSRGSTLLRFPAFERFAHVTAGLVIVGCGAVIHLGL